MITSGGGRAPDSTRRSTVLIALAPIASATFREGNSGSSGSAGMLGCSLSCDIADRMQPDKNLRLKVESQQIDCVIRRLPANYSQNSGEQSAGNLRTVRSARRLFA